MRPIRTTAIFLIALVLASSQAFLPLPTSAQDKESLLVEVTGHGWGHGRGMGQYGAQGYALGLDGGTPWTSAQVLDHFYGDTQAGPIPAGAIVDPAAVRVEIRSNRGQALIANVGAGKIHLKNPAGDLLWSNDAGLSVRLSLAPGGIRFEQGPSCGGPWTEVFVTGETGITLVDQNPADDSNGLLQVCHADGSSTWLDGTVGLHNVGGETRTVNTVSIEQYLRGVLPAEVPVSWEPAALEAQAVAARSYAMAGDSRQLPYADTCDTTLCQVYRGRYRQTAARGLELSTHPKADAAVAATAGLVRIRNGGVARTEFSSSTGGHTAGGAFPSIVDVGDSVESNPNHDWSTVIDLASFVEAQNKGNLIGVEETGNGLGEHGGRVVSVTFTFTGGTVALTGNEARQRFGFKSDWFQFGQVGATSINANGRFVAATYRLFVQRDPSLTEQVNWQNRLDGGVAKTELTTALAQSDEWAGVMLDDLYQVVLGRPSDPGGRLYWLNQMRTGLRFEQVAANFFGAPEYYESSGGTDAAFVSALYLAILERTPDLAGLSFWVNQLATDTISSYEVAAGFYASPESRQDRVIGLYQQVLGRAPDAAGLGHWTTQLLTVDDVQLAASLAASPEFFERAQP